jgi:HlyD family secretion protein
MRNIGSKLFMIVVVAVVAGGLAYAFVPRPVETDLVKVERGTVRVTVDEDGRTRIHDKYVVSAPLNGRILRINLRPGDKVEAGKTLLTMIEPRDPDLLDARSVAQAEARVKAAEDTLHQMQPELEKVHVQQAYAEAEMTRVRKAFLGKGVSQSDVENAEMLLHQRNEEMRSAKLSEEIARFELEQAQAALIRSRPRTDVAAQSKKSNAAQLAMAELIPKNNGSQEETAAATADVRTTNWDFPIYSPIEGRVLRVMQESSAVVMPGTALIELGDPLDLEVAVDVLSRDAVKIHPGDQMILEHWGGTTPLHARVRVVEPSGFTKISTLGVEEQRVWVIADLVEPFEQRPTLGDEFRVEARIVIDEARNVIRVPTSALFRVGEDSAVFRVEDGVAHQHKVKTGRQNGLDAEITEGLTEGDLVVLHPSDQIEDGTKVHQR